MTVSPTANGTGGGPNCWSSRRASGAAVKPPLRSAPPSAANSLPRLDRRDEPGCPLLPLEDPQFAMGQLGIIRNRHSQEAAHKAAETAGSGRRTAAGFASRARPRAVPHRR